MSQKPAEVDAHSFTLRFVVDDVRTTKRQGLWPESHSRQVRSRASTALAPFVTPRGWRGTWPYIARANCFRPPLSAFPSFPFLQIAGHTHRPTVAPTSNQHNRSLQPPTPPSTPTWATERTSTTPWPTADGRLHRLAVRQGPDQRLLQQPPQELQQCSGRPELCQRAFLRRQGRTLPRHLPRLGYHQRASQWIFGKPAPALQ